TTASSVSIASLSVHDSVCAFLLFMTRPPPPPPLFPYTTLFRSPTGLRDMPKERWGDEHAIPCATRPRRCPPLSQCFQPAKGGQRSEEHTSELQSRSDLVCRLLLEKKKKTVPHPPLPHTCPSSVT